VNGLVGGRKEYMMDSRSAHILPGLASVNSPVPLLAVWTMRLSLESGRALDHDGRGNGMDLNGGMDGWCSSSLSSSIYTPKAKLYSSIQSIVGLVNFYGASRVDVDSPRRRRGFSSVCRPPAQPNV
jgi:hypothetical protein